MRICNSQLTKRLAVQVDKFCWLISCWLQMQNFTTIGGLVWCFGGCYDDCEKEWLELINEPLNSYDTLFLTFTTSSWQRCDCQPNTTQKWILSYQMPDPTGFRGEISDYVSSHYSYWKHPTLNSEQNHWTSTDQSTVHSVLTRSRLVLTFPSHILGESKSETWPRTVRRIQDFLEGSANF